MKILSTTEARPTFRVDMTVEELTYLYCVINWSSAINESLEGTCCDMPVEVRDAFSTDDRKAIAAAITPYYPNKCYEMD